MLHQLPLTETRNAASHDIDHRSTTEILQLINDEDKHVPIAVEGAVKAIAQASEDNAGPIQKANRRRGRCGGLCQ